MSEVSLYVDLRHWPISGEVRLKKRPLLVCRGGLVFKAHRLVYHSTLGLRVIKKKKKRSPFSCEYSTDRPSSYLRGATPCVEVQGYLAHKKSPTPLGPPKDPAHMPTVGSYGVAFSYQRGTPVGRGP